MAYTTILSNKQSTYGSPYGFYTVQYEETARSATAVTLAIKILAHLQYAESYQGYSLTATLTIGGKAFTIPLKGTEMWSGTTVHTITASVSAPASAQTTSLAATFSVSGTPDNSTCLTSTACSNISISRYYTAASISASSGTIGQAVAITLSGKYPSNAVCDVTYKFGNASGTIASGTSASSLTWDTSLCAEALLAEIPDALRGTCTLTCVTKLNGSTIGSRSCSLTLSTSEKAEIISVTCAPVNDNSFFEEKGVYVAGYSRCRVTTEAEPGQGASISSYSITGLDRTGSSRQWVSDVINEEGKKTIKVTVTDSRGTAASSEDIEIEALSYREPFVIVRAERGTFANEIWSSDINGENLKITAAVSLSLGSIGNKGAFTLKLDGETVAARDDVTGEVVQFIASEVDNKVTHRVSAVVTDLVGKSSTESVAEIPTAVVNMSMLPDNGGVTFGGYPLQTGLVSEFPAKFNNNVFIDIAAAGFSETFASKCGSEDNGLVSLKTILLNFAYPIGSYYWSSESTEPEALFGGKWERVTDKFMLAAGNTYSAGTSGGEASHKLTEAEMPSHTHSVSATAASNGAHVHQSQGYWSAGNGTAKAISRTKVSGDPVDTNSLLSAGAHTHSVSGTAAAKGGSTAHNNMPPYITAYCWKRTE